MKKGSCDQKKVLRIVDANYNRAKEALRVVEDIFRFCRTDKRATQRVRLLRHRLSAPFQGKKIFTEMIAQRDSRKDIGRPLDRLELKRGDLDDILYANLQRAKESLRVLEETSKILDRKSVSKFKGLRYNLYSFEKTL